MNSLLLRLDCSSCGENQAEMHFKLPTMLGHVLPIAIEILRKVAKRYATYCGWCRVGEENEA